MLSPSTSNIYTYRTYVNMKFSLPEMDPNIISSDPAYAYNINSKEKALVGRFF